jgi:hypothetical protein
MLNVRCSVFVLCHTRADRAWLQPIATSFVAPIHGPVLQANPAKHVRRVPPQTSASLSVFKKIDILVGSPPFIWSTAVKVPHPNATNTISMPVGTQAPGVPSGNFGKNSENPLQFVGPGRTGNQNRCCFFPA